MSKKNVISYFNSKLMKKYISTNVLPRRFFSQSAALAFVLGQSISINLKKLLERLHNIAQFK